MVLYRASLLTHFSDQEEKKSLFDSWLLLKLDPHFLYRQNHSLRVLSSSHPVPIRNHYHSRGIFPIDLTLPGNTDRLRASWWRKTEWFVQRTEPRSVCLDPAKKRSTITYVWVIAENFWEISALGHSVTIIACTWSSSCLSRCNCASNCLLWSSNTCILASRRPLCWRSSLASASSSESLFWGPPGDASPSGGRLDWSLMDLSRSYSSWRSLAK